MLIRNPTVFDQRLIVATVLLLTSMVAGGSWPPVPAYASLPVIDEVKISPDGTRLVLLRTVAGQQRAFVRDLKSSQERQVLALDRADTHLSRCRWANLHRLLCSVYRSGTRTAGIGRREQLPVRETRLIGVNADGTELRRLIRPPATGNARDRKYDPLQQDNIIAMLADDPDHVLLALNRDDPTVPSVYRLNVYTGALKRVHRHRADIQWWQTDASGQVRIGIGIRDSRPYVIMRQDGRWKNIHAERLDDFVPSFMGLAADGKRAYIATRNGSDRIGLYEFAMETGTVGKAVFIDERFDFIGGVFTRQNQLTGISYLADRTEFVWLTDESQRFDAAVKQHFPDRSYWLMSSTSDRRLHVLQSRKLGGPPAWHVYDAEADHLSHLGSAWPMLKDADLAEMRPVEYLASDGTNIPAYLTLPPGVERGAGLPAVVLPHGGPFARDSVRFNHWTQLIASRGIAVLQPNFRGSFGYGRAYMESGYGEWGGLMQADVMDGVDWLIGSGIADPDRICMVGASYGGYVSLLAAARAPDRIRCAVSYAGITDVAELVTDLAKYDMGDETRHHIGDPDKDRADLLSRSPLRLAGFFEVPVLVAHGTFDGIIDPNQSRRFVTALESNGKSVQHVELPGGDHELSLESDRITFFSALDTFLRQHLLEDEPAQPRD